MSNTVHHGCDNHKNHDYGGRYNCNKAYNQSYGKFGRKRAAIERRNDDKKEVRFELRNIDEGQYDFYPDECVIID